MIYLPCKDLTDEEVEMRREMVYCFNPVLKYLFYSRNPIGFAQYGFNSCRQTAIFGAGYMQEMYPDYTYKVFEGHFHDVVDMKPVDYVHAFIIAQKDFGTYNKIRRSILIDLSRTSRPVKFQVIKDWGNIYDKSMQYRDCCLEKYEELDLDQMLHMPENEFLTSMPPQDTMRVLKALIEQVHQMDPEDRKAFWKSIYSSFTNLIESEVSTQ